MKTGYNVWWFEPTLDEIVCFVVTGFYQYLAGVTRMEGHYPGKNEQTVFICTPQKVFPTREALCEHYRKIFE